jgi:hypothetical protein
LSIDAALEAVVCSGTTAAETTRAGKVQLFLDIVHSCACSDQFDPCLRLSFGFDLDVKVARRREEAEAVLIGLFGILLPSNGCEFGEVDLVAEFGFIAVFVDGEEVWSQNDVYWFPVLQRGAFMLARSFPRETYIWRLSLKEQCPAHLCLARPLEHFASFDDAIKLEATILRDRREGFQR